MSLYTVITIADHDKKFCNGVYTASQRGVCTVKAYKSWKSAHVVTRLFIYSIL